MSAAQEGDAKAYRDLLGDLSQWLRRYYRRRLPLAMVDDATQEALLAVHRKRHTYDPRRPFGPWIGSIARYKWIDRLRVLESSSLAELNEELAVPDPADTVACASVLDHMLGNLKQTQSEVIRLVKIQGLTIEEASQFTGQSESLVKVNIHRGLARLIALARSEPRLNG